jgi:hypothetical protein
MVDWHKSDLENRMYLTLEGGKKIAMPRYFKDKIYTKTVTYYTGSGIPIVTVPGERERIAFFAQIDNAEREEKALAARIREFGDDHVRQKVEADKAAFERMYKKAVDGRNKV